jgi:nucleoside-diphosphate-sugar epimerase
METLKNAHLLVVGGTGFIGHHLLKSAINKVCKLTSVSLNPPSEERFVEGVRYIHFDTANKYYLQQQLKDDYDYAVNLGGYINHKLFKDSGRELIETHFNAIQNLVEILPRHSLKRFIQIGSSDEYGNAKAPQQEEQREQAISPYSLAKVASTHFLQMLHRTENFPAVILRLFLTYGPGQDSTRFLPQIIRGCLNNETFRTSAGEQLRDFCYVDDTVRAILQALTHPEIDGNVFNVASGEGVAIRTMIKKVCQLTGTGKPLFGELPYRTGENMTLYGDLTKTKSILSWEPLIPLDDGLKHTIDFFKQYYA